MAGSSEQSAGNAGDGVVGNSGADHNANATRGADSNAGPVFFDPGSVTAPVGNSDTGNSGATGKRGRGRPRKSSASGGAAGREETEAPDYLKRAPFSVDGVSAILLSIHQMLAGFTHLPELEIEPSEAARMAEALKGVADQYDVKPTEKSLAWINLATAASMVYGTRIFAFRMRMAAEKAERAGPRGQTQSRPVIVS